MFFDIPSRCAALQEQKDWRRWAEAGLWIAQSQGEGRHIHSQSEQAAEFKVLCVRTRFAVSRRTSPRAPEGRKEEEIRRCGKKEDWGKCSLELSPPMAHFKEPSSSVSALQDHRLRMKTRGSQDSSFQDHPISATPPTPQNGTWCTTLLPSLSKCLYMRTVLQSTGSSIPSSHCSFRNPALQWIPAENMSPSSRTNLSHWSLKTIETLLLRLLFP